MSEVAYSLWAPEIKPTAQSPFTILDTQARALTKQTDGILLGDLRVVSSSDDLKTSLHLDMVVPALDNLRHGVLTATYSTDLIYPVRIDAPCFRRKIALTTIGRSWTGEKQENEAASDEEFRKLVEQVLRSDEVKSAAQSLIARANEVLKQREPKDNGKDSA